MPEKVTVYEKQRVRKEYGKCYICSIRAKEHWVENDLTSSFRWKALKEQLLAELGKLGNYADLKQFYRDYEDIEEWINEMLPTACDESYKDPTNIQASSK